MRELPALKVHQWLPEWDSVRYDDTGTRRHPPSHFYVFSIPAKDLRALSGIQRRSAELGNINTTDQGIQRRHDPARTTAIKDYMRLGYPQADFSDDERGRAEYADSKMPGWLPTAIVVNILNSEFPDQRKGISVAKGDYVQIKHGNGPIANILLPEGLDSQSWRPKALPPIEIIDGQHRLWAFENNADFDGYELPVVAFYGLDVTWQAYLFYTINIRPVKINTSLAFDLYPLLRTEKWLEHDQVQGPRVYRETRAQEIVRSLYVHPESPWRNHINMLGDPGQNMVRQAAWIRSLLATYIRPNAGRRMLIGGLFGSTTGDEEQNLDWHGAQQSAFVIHLGGLLRDSILDIQQDWSKAIRENDQLAMLPELDPAFYSRHSLLNTDQGVRGFLSITNDISVVSLDEFKLRDWSAQEFGSAYDEEAISAAVQSLSSHSRANFLEELMSELATFDWRTSTAPGLDVAQRTNKRLFRGSGGYREIRRQLLIHLADRQSSVTESAKRAFEILGFERD